MRKGNKYIKVPILTAVYHGSYSEDTHARCIGRPVFDIRCTGFMKVCQTFTDGQAYPLAFDSDDTFMIELRTFEYSGTAEEARKEIYGDCYEAAKEAGHGDYAFP